jgi:chromosome segregation ATPase
MTIEEQLAEANQLAGIYAAEASDLKTTISALESKLGEANAEIIARDNSIRELEAKVAGLAIAAESADRRALEMVASQGIPTENVEIALAEQPSDDPNLSILQPLKHLTGRERETYIAKNSSEIQKALKQTK